MKLLICFFIWSFKNVVFQIRCTGFGRKNMIGVGKSLWSCQNCMMALLLRMFLPSKLKFKSSGIYFCMSMPYNFYAAKCLSLSQVYFTLHNRMCFLHRNI